MTSQGLKVGRSTAVIMVCLMLLAACGNDARSADRMQSLQSEPMADYDLPQATSKDIRTDAGSFGGITGKTRQASIRTYYKVPNEDLDEAFESAKAAAITAGYTQDADSSASRYQAALAGVVPRVGIIIFIVEKDNVISLRLRTAG